ncbi:hypothetical protein BSM4216_1786 [Bacillus smithii]|nr:hypothetical protein BSM4216_1786 [Bacillus smithii]
MDFSPPDEQGFLRMKRFCMQFLTKKQTSKVNEIIMERLANSLF